MKFIPLNDKVLIRRKEQVEITKGGLIIPDRSQEKPLEGVVISVGEGSRDKQGELIPILVKEGDVVLVGKFAGTEITINGEELLLVRAEEILGRFNNE